MLDSIRHTVSSLHPVEVDDPEAAQAAVAVVLVPGGDAGVDLLLIQRAARTGDPWSGQMALPGGRRSPDEPDLLDTAIRETREETAIRLERAGCIGALHDLHPTTRVLPKIVVRPFVFALAERPSVQPNHEVAGVFWTGLGQLRRSQGRATVNARGAELVVDAFNVHDRVVWGMTYRILKPFLSLVNNAVP